ncbi:MAG: MgtC/SapB family protein [Phycisphaerae bacterium]|nr:MgtC/SapB family protein [Phycisphaerae bacterium]MBN8598528.1 MgtC/SapB family protein [Planctomycetota bacterium]
MDPITHLETAARIAAALGLGAAIGIERQLGKHPAGFRTMTLISIGSAAFVLIVLKVGAGGTALGSDSAAQATSRVLQGLTTGIGFLGAGTIVRAEKSVHGLTTAAAVWCVAAIGAACGLGELVLASMLTAAALITLIVLKLGEKPLRTLGPTSKDSDAPQTPAPNGQPNS